jgi:uncharacterized membrane protein
MGYGAWPGFGFGGGLAAIGCVLLVVGVVVLIAWLLGRTGPAAQSQAAQLPTSQLEAPRSPEPDALEVLRLRFARGEMTADELVAARRTLEESR